MWCLKSMYKKIYCIIIHPRLKDITMFAVLCAMQYAHELKNSSEFLTKIANLV